MFQVPTLVFRIAKPGKSWETPLSWYATIFYILVHCTIFRTAVSAGKHVAAAAPAHKKGKHHYDKLKINVIAWKWMSGAARKSRY